MQRVPTVVTVLVNPSTSWRISEAAGDQGLQERRYLRAAVQCVTAPFFAQRPELKLFISLSLYLY